MTLRNLTPEEETILDLIIVQREKSERDDDCFIYSIGRGQKTLKANGKAVEYGIGCAEQFQIIQKLAEDGIIDADWITVRTGQEIPKYKFAHHDEKWLWDKFGDVLMFFTEKDCRDSIFIQLSFNHIRTINETCRTKYHCTLLFNSAKLRFYVNCDNGEKYVVKKLRNGLPPFEVLKVALEHPREIVTREDLKDNGINVGKRSIATQVFDDNSVVRNELAMFARLTNDSICVDPEADLTLVDLENLKKVCF